MAVRPPGPPPPPPPPPNKDAIAAIVDVLKLETSLATGVLVFSIGLVTSTSIIYSAGAKPWLIGGWIILALSVIAGVWGLAYAAVLYSDPAFTLNSAEVRVTTGINQAAFVIGSLVVAGVLVVALWIGPARDEGRVRSPIAALQIAEKAPGVAEHRIEKVSAIELLKGTDSVYPRRDPLAAPTRISDIGPNRHLGSREGRVTGTARYSVLAAVGLGVPVLLTALRGIGRDWSEANLTLLLIRNSHEASVRSLVRGYIRVAAYPRTDPGVQDYSRASGAREFHPRPSRPGSFTRRVGPRNFTSSRSQIRT